MSRELTSQYPALTLCEELARFEPIVYSANGNRASSGEVFLAQIEQVAPLVGITRVADISRLSPTPFPVYQSCRPHLYLSADYGQNSGAQGKGVTQTQARISCLMEAIESYCVEPRVPQLLRASWDYLHKQRLAVHPDQFIQRTGSSLSADKQLMWTPVYSVRLQREVYVPAETVYFPFIPSYYDTNAGFIDGSNGLASGATYLEATIHALYELIERFYVSSMDCGDLNVEALYEGEIEDPSLRSVLAQESSDYCIQLYAFFLPGIKNLPMVRACLISGDTFYSGWGCAATVDIAISRAISEVLQCRATHISGSREDMKIHTCASMDTAPEDDVFGLCEQPEERTLHIENFRHRVHDYCFSTLGEEFQFVLSWLSEIGHDNILIANLTRRGIDVPVVKVLIPSLDVPNEFKNVTSFEKDEGGPFYRQFRVNSRPERGSA
jgi:ribosomal protein S12 methylthiotransferase accessory factor